MATIIGFIYVTIWSLRKHNTMIYVLPQKVAEKF